MDATIYMLNDFMTLHQDTFYITGEMTFATVSELWAVSQKLFPPQSVWKCDFSQVTACDSAGLALLLEWIKWARHLKKSVHFFKIPEQLYAIAHAASLDALLGN